MSQGVETKAAEERLILNTHFLLSANIINHNMISERYFIPRIHIQNLCLTILKFSLNSFEYFMFSLGSNESEKDEVEKPPMKKRKGQKKAPHHSNV